MASNQDVSSRHVVIVGGGSAAFSAAIEANELGAEVTIINDGLPIGGTCVNVGCVPSKTLLRAAEAHHFPQQHQFAGIDGRSKLESFEAVIDQKRKLVERLQQAKYRDVLRPLDRVRFLEAKATFASPKTIEVNGRRLDADSVIIATGATPSTPPIDGLEGVDYLTNETAFELEECPESMVVLGGGYVGLECGQMFARFGTDVTVLERESQILPAEMVDVADGLHRYLVEEGLDIKTDAEVERVRRTETGVELDVQSDTRSETIKTEELLLATGRSPNTRELGLDEAGISLAEGDFVDVDSTLRTNKEDIYAAGDVIGHPMFVYTAAYEGKLAVRNALSDSPSVEVDYAPLPWVVFTDPQVAGVGLAETQAAKQGFESQTTTLPLSEVPRAIAARDTRGFIKLIRETSTDRLLGGRVVAPEGGELLMQLGLAIRHEMTIEELTSVIHPYLTLSEGVRLAAMTFDKEVSELSCCAG